MKSSRGISCEKSCLKPRREFLSLFTLKGTTRVNKVNKFCLCAFLLKVIYGFLQLQKQFHLESQVIFLVCSQTPAL